MAFIAIVIFLNLIPPLLAGLIDFSIQGSLTSNFEGTSDFFYALSPVVYFSSRVGSSWGYPLPSLPLIIAYLLLAWISHSSFRIWRDMRAETVACKIKEMTSDPEPVMP